VSMECKTGPVKGRVLAGRGRVDMVKEDEYG
jgi:hypothetical protein